VTEHYNLPFPKDLKRKYFNPESEKEWKEWLKDSKYKPIVNIENHDTIGMIALDANGNLSRSTTSGMALKWKSRRFTHYRSRFIC
jgi:N4-(beta-N-acetylglucosaminyl)-L-asparaginase